MKIRKHLSSGNHVLQKKLEREKFDMLCSESINKSELEDSLTSDLLNLLQNSTYDIGESYFKALDKIKFCNYCKIEINISLLSDHIISKKHKDFE